MPRPKALNPPIPEKVYLSQENAATLKLLSTSSLTGRAIFSRKSDIVNEALAHYFSLEFKEFLEWKTKKQQPDLPSSVTKSSEGNV